MSISVGVCGSLSFLDVILVLLDKDVDNFLEELNRFSRIDGGKQLDITIISDSPLLEHDAMYMLQHYDKARQRLLEIQARDERRIKLAIEAGMSTEELEMLEKEVSESRKGDKDDGAKKTVDKKKKKPAAKAAAKKGSSKMMSFDEKADKDDVF